MHIKSRVHQRQPHALTHRYRQAHLADDHTKPPPPIPAKPAAAPVVFAVTPATKPKSRGKLVKSAAAEAEEEDAASHVAEATPDEPMVKGASKGKKLTQPAAADEAPAAAAVADPKKGKSKKVGPAKADSKSIDEAAGPAEMGPKQSAKPANKRKRGDEETSKDENTIPAAAPAYSHPRVTAAAAFPMERSLSFKAALSLSSLKFSVSEQRAPAEEESKSNKRARPSRDGVASRLSHREPSCRQW